MILYDQPRREGAEMFVDATLMDTVGFLCLPEGHSRGEDRKPVGSCFFTHMWKEDGSRAYGYLVTARHVVEMNSLNQKKALVRLNDIPLQKARYYSVLYPWRFPTDPTVDLAIASFGHTSDHHDTHVRSSGIMKLVEEIDGLKLRAPWPPQPGEDVFGVGLLPDVAGSTRNFPVVRRGWMASASTEPIAGYYGPSDYYVVDIQSYFGHSGAPVYVSFQPTGLVNPAYLLGFLASSYPAPPVDGAVNMGVSLVVPMEKLVELIMSDELKAERKEIDRERAHAGAIPMGVPPSEKEGTFTQDDFLDALKRVSRKQSDEEKSET